MLPGCVRGLGHHAWKMARANWHLGFTAFGGPPVHFRIFNEKFVNKIAWIDEQVYQELFSVSQAFSGPASTKMLYCINLIRHGFLAAVLGFLIWSLPGAIGMYALSIGVSNVREKLPDPVYALLSGLNAATVGVIALAAVELSHKAITDRLTRIIVFLTGAAGMLYNALWYFPVLMVVSGLATLVFDFRWLHRPATKLAHAAQRLHRPWSFRRTPRQQPPDESPEAGPPQPDHQQPTSTPLSDLPITEPPTHRPTGTTTPTKPPSSTTASSEPRIIPPSHQLSLPPSLTWKTGTAIIAAFLAIFITATALRGALRHPTPPLLYRLFANMFLAGTIIFGGGPVVIPLLREYVVAEGWVSARDFLIGLALIQAFPGPNFNFAVFLGSLAALNGGYSSVAGAVIAWVGIFAPGLVMVHGTMGIWGAIRGRRWVRSVLRGVNAGAVGLMYTAVYRIFVVGYVDAGFQAGKSLADDPWWVIITATSYVGGRYFGVSAPLAIVLGAVLGLLRYAVVSA